MIMSESSRKLTTLFFICSLHMQAEICYPGVNIEASVPFSTLVHRPVAAAIAPVGQTHAFVDMLAQLPITHPLVVSKAFCRPSVPHRRPLQVRNTITTSSHPFCRAISENSHRGTSTNRRFVASKHSDRAAKQKTQAQATESDVIDIEGHVQDMRIPVTVSRVTLSHAVSLVKVLNKLAIQHFNCVSKTMLCSGDHRFPWVWQDHLAESYPDREPRQTHSCNRE